MVQGPLQPQLTALHATGAKERLQNAYLRGGRYALWAALLLAVPLMVYSRELFGLYLGPKVELYKASATVMVLLLPIFAIAYGHVMLANVALATAQVRSWAARACVIQMINLGLTFYFVGMRRMGAVGSALATFVAMTFGLAIMGLMLTASGETGLPNGYFTRMFFFTLGPGQVNVWPLLVGMGVIVYGLGFTLWLYAMELGARFGQAHRLPPLAYLSPVLAVAVGWALLREGFGPGFWGGTVLIVAGNGVNLLGRGKAR